MNKRDSILFITGSVGLALLVLATLLIGCPTISQERTLNIALGLMSALIAACIPGILGLRIDALPALPIQAGGGIVVFILVVWFRPAALASEPVELQFSNASCQGNVPVGKEINITKLPPALDPTQQQLKSESALGRPVSFTFNYTFGEYAGSRRWTQVKPGVWIEMYPNEILFSAFREVGQQKLFNCMGTVVERQDSSHLKIFIPNKGCDDKLWFNASSGGEWAYLGEMKSVE
ncbi:hypothetical protein ACIPZ8_22680 [Pseudomonas sp. NPDC089422]|uniref:hypothetical protein n=1 Tax=Pseudomonas sp. NPDC089422 TaxID=3364466 RepID=UPI00382D034C